MKDSSAQDCGPLDQFWQVIGQDMTKSITSFYGSSWGDMRPILSAKQLYFVHHVLECHRTTQSTFSQKPEYVTELSGTCAERGLPSLGDPALFNGEPDCDQVRDCVSIVQNGNNDASSGGYAADMDTSVNLAIYQRLEISDAAE